MLTKRQYITLVVMGILAVLLLLAPRIFVPALSVSNGNNAQKDLEAYGKSISGDSSYDAQASSLGNRVIVHRLPKGTYYTLMDDKNCFKLEAGSTVAKKVNSAECN